MASSTLLLPSSYHQSTPSVPKNKLETKKVRSEDELLKFFLHGSYDVQRGNAPVVAAIEDKNNETKVSMEDENLLIDEQKKNSRFMFEETYMINISLKKPNAKQIDVRIEKSPPDTENPPKKSDMEDDDEISSIFDEEDHDEADSVIFNEINSTSIETSKEKLTLADMINKSLTTIPAMSMDNLNKMNNWYVEQPNEGKTRKISAESLPTKTMEKIPKISPPPIKKPILTTNIKEDEKLFEYLDYLDTKEESKAPTVQSHKCSSFFKIFIFSLDKTFEANTSTRSNINHRSRTTLSFINCS